MLKLAQTNQQTNQQTWQKQYVPHYNKCSQGFDKANIKKTAPASGGHVSQQTRTIVELIGANQQTNQPTDQQTGQKHYVPHYYNRQTDRRTNADRTHTAVVEQTLLSIRRLQCRQAAVTVPSILSTY
ncbi:hypothetical protein DPMN_121415 [Dreissena polymorpha]|uniref:Uncharacterized protein n=1 Tax=Dreissena polymorpha TaxID=45954 RepID=A0A9D4GQ21_DREPO|nr:hypothetical protein DPMN_121415 [Dreissena polymorpha]